MKAMRAVSAALLALTAVSNAQRATLTQMSSDGGLLMWGDGYVCDDAFGREDAQVACRELGMTYVSHRGSSLIPGGTRNFSMDDVNCRGTETALSQCEFTSEHNCSGREGVRLVCRGGAATTAAPTTPGPSGDFTRVDATDCNPGQDIGLCGQWDSLQALRRDCNANTECTAYTAVNGEPWCMKRGSSFVNEPRWDHTCYQKNGVGGVGDESGTCGNPIPLDSMESPYSDTTEGRDNGFNLSCGGSGPEIVFSIRVPDGGRLSIGQTENNYDSRHQLSYGSSCPGTTVICRDDQDTTEESWTNDTGSTQTAYFVIDAFSTASGAFTLAWTCKGCEGTGTGSTTGPQQLALADGQSGLVMYGDGYMCDDWNTNASPWNMPTTGNRNANAQVICRQLGFEWEGARYQLSQRLPDSAMVDGRANFSMDDLSCDGSERRVEDCEHTTEEHNCYQSEGVSVTCGPASAGGDGLRLSNGRTGLVQYDDGYVCDDAWFGQTGNANAQVICRQLGFPWQGATFELSQRLPEGTNDFTLDDLRCEGEEASVEDCPSLSDHNCQPTEGVSVTCQEAAATPAPGRLRLSDGISGYAMYNDGYVCDDGWSSWGNRGTSNAQVICRQLGYGWQGATYEMQVVLPEDTMDFTLDDLRCNGDEDTIETCQRAPGEHNCQRNEGVQVTCGEAPELSLSNGSNGFVMYGGGYVCDDWGMGGWGGIDIGIPGFPTIPGILPTIPGVGADSLQNNADVICRQLGYTGEALYEIRQQLPDDGIDFTMDDLRCTGDESAVEECEMNVDNHNCARSEGVVVTCAGGQSGSGGSGSSDGVSLEAFTDAAGTDYDGVLSGLLRFNNGYVCDDEFGVADATVACRELGLEYQNLGTAQSLGTRPQPEEIFGSFTMDDAQCEGTERRLEDCTHTTEHNCYAGEGVLLVCGREPRPQNTDGVSLSEDGLLMYNGGYVCDDNWDRFGDWGSWGTDMWDFGSIFGSGSGGMGSGGLPDMGSGDHYYGDDSGNSGDRNAAVVCRELGLEAEGASWASSVQLPNNIFTVDDLNCEGTEASIADCEMNPIGEHNCSTYEGVRVQCGGASDFNIVLGDDGMLMVSQDGNLGYVCDDGFTATDARVACRELGLEFTSYETQVITPADNFLVDDLDCSGDESRLSECPHTGQIGEDCSASEGVTLVCNGAQDMQIMLSDDNLLQVQLNGEIGYVCDDWFNQSTAEVVCRELGLASAGVYYETSQEVSEDRFYLDDLRCSGTESSVRDCDYTHTDNCFVGEGVRVFCGADSQLRAARAADGVVEIYRGDERGYLCDDGFNQNAAEVFCREIGLPWQNARFETNISIPEDMFFLDNIECTGQENALSECEGQRSYEDCGTSEGVRVFCEGPAGGNTSGLDAGQVCEATEQCSWVQTWVGSLRENGELVQAINGRLTAVEEIPNPWETIDALSSSATRFANDINRLNVVAESAAALEPRLSSLEDREADLDAATAQITTLTGQLEDQQDTIDALNEQLRITNELLTALSARVDAGGSGSGGEPEPEGPANPCDRELSGRDVKQLTKCVAAANRRKCVKNSSCAWLDDACTFDCTQRRLL